MKQYLALLVVLQGSWPPVLDRQHTLGALQKTSPILAPRPEWSRVFKRSSTKIEYSNGDRIALWRTPCRIGNELEWLPH